MTSLVKAATILSSAASSQVITRCELGMSSLNSAAAVSRQNPNWSGIMSSRLSWASLGVWAPSRYERLLV